jgi:leader peptidase (prepilin peptidase)/N-methyltransferase
MDEIWTLRPLLHPALFPWLALALGLIVGSFANVVVHRLPLGQSVVSPRSRCPSCQRPIQAIENVPVLSWVALLGRCRGCRAPISVRYPLVEAANGAGYMALAWWLGPQPRALVLMAFFTAMLVLALIDYDHHLLPDAITFPGIAVGLLASLLPGPPTPLESALSAAGGYLAFGAVAVTFRKIRGIEGLGRGDWKMAALLGAFLGWQGMLLTAFVAILSATLVGLAVMAFGGKSSKHELPLGTFLAIAGIVTVFVGEPILAWYGNLLRV